MNQKHIGYFIGSTGLLGIALGAFGAHGLRDVLSVEMMAVYQTGVLYHLLHSVALVGILCAPKDRWETPWPKRICMAWLIGIVLFSGSLYTLSLSGITVLGAITPFGGLAFMIGWLMVMFLFRHDTN